MVYSLTTQWTRTILTLATLQTLTEPATVQLPQMHVITDFIHKYVQPYLDTVKVDGPILRAERKHGNTNIQQLVRDKVNELKHLLQDDQFSVPDNEDELTLEGEEETTIIEIMPETKNKHKEALRQINDKQRALKSHISKYKKMRNEINKALIKESVSNHTQLMVTKMIDDLMAKIVEHQCNWNDFPAANVMFRTKKNTHPLELAKTWGKLWLKLKKQYLKSTEFGKDKEVFFRDFQNFVGIMLNDMQTLSQHYKIQCKVIDKKGVELGNTSISNSSLFVLFSTKNPARTGKEAGDSKDITRTGVEPIESKENNDEDITVGGVEKDSCANFKICSEELTDFMVDFYKTLNDTAVSTLRNYAAMFVRDVSPDGKYEKSNVVTLINKIGDETEVNVKKAFHKQIRKLKLDENKRQEINIRVLNEFVQKTILHTKNHIKKSSIENLSTLRSKLLDTVKKDVYVNLDVDLGNLERELSGRICTVFQICNGRFTNSRRSGYMPYLSNKNDIYVKVQLTLDDELKEELSKKVHYRSLMGNNKIFDNNKRYYRKGLVSRSSPLVWVTRTSLVSKDFDFTNKLPSSFDADKIIDYVFKENTTIRVQTEISTEKYRDTFW